MGTSVAGTLALANRARKIRAAWQIWSNRNKGGPSSKPKTPKPKTPKPDYTSKDVPKNEIPDWVKPQDGPFTRDADGTIRSRTGDTVADVDGDRYVRPGDFQDSTGSTWTGRPPRSGGGGGGPKPPRGGGP